MKQYERVFFKGDSEYMMAVTSGPDDKFECFVYESNAKIVLTLDELLEVWDAAKDGKMGFYYFLKTNGINLTAPSSEAGELTDRGNKQNKQ